MPPHQTSLAMNFQADRIELVLASHKLPARVTGGTVTPRWVRYQLSTPLGVRVRQVAALAEELALSLGVPACRVVRNADQLQVEVPRPDPQPVLLHDLCLRLARQQTRQAHLWPPLTAILGLDGDGTPLLLHLPSPDVAHVLIAGTTGSGKTALARTLVASLAVLNSQRRLQLLLVDPKGQGFLPFAGLPHLLEPVVTAPHLAIPPLARLVAEMERRDAEGRTEPRLVVVLDELADLLQVGGRELEGLVRRLTQRGRGAGIHLLACTQKPAAMAIGGLVKSNFPLRLVGSVTSPEDAKVASGLAATGAERLLGRGDFLLVAKGQVTRLQAAYADPAEIRRLVQQLQQGAQPWLLAGTGTDGPQQAAPPAARAADRRPALLRQIK
jgi:DNA segregation ATPase FtsK/SpoIIIE, S-DNA-T family